MLDKPNAEHDISFQQGVIAMGVAKSKLIEAEDRWMDKVRWSYIVGQFGSQVKVYSGI